MSVEQCRELLVELQQLGLRLIAQEQVVANAVQVGEQAQQLSSQPGG
jgi:formate-dependent phosphoribosylglycinamide formyltransferase (GAR transformylase)